MKRRFKRGFTLMELLIVVAISIPIFTNQLERSRESTDMANVRKAYAEVLSEAMMGEQNSKKIESRVFLKQKVEDFQSISKPDIGGITKDNNEQWIGKPQPEGRCLVYYDMEKGVILDWNDSSYNRLLLNMGTVANSWEGGANKITTGRADRLSSEKLLLLEKGKQYQANFKLPDDLTEEEKKYLDGYEISVGTLLFSDKDGKSKAHHDSKWQAIPAGEKNSLTINNINADKDENYLGINLKLTKKGTKNDYSFKNNNSQEAKVLEGVLKRVLQNVEII